MGPNTEKHLQDIIRTLTEQGIGVGQLSHIHAELQNSHRPWYHSIKNTITVQWSHILGEAAELKKLSMLLMKREELNIAEKNEVREQLSDLFRLVPAGLIAAANAVLPIPGTSMLTPMLLKKAKLLPSRWREAHMLASLQSEHRRLKQLGETQVANALLELCSEICDEADQRALACDLLSVWDSNQNGIWDLDEIERYNSEVSAVNHHFKSHAQHRQWYVMQSGFVFGPTALPEQLDDPQMMISYEGQTRWVRYIDAQNNAQFSVDEPPVLPSLSQQAE